MVPLGLFVSQVLKLGGQPLSLQFGLRVYGDGPISSPPKPSPIKRERRFTSPSQPSREEALRGTW